MFVMLFIGIGIIGIQRRRIRKQAEKVGVQVDFPSSGPDVHAIEGSIYCIGFIIISIFIAIFTALGISLPLVIPEATEMIVGIIAGLALGGLFWGVGVAAIPITIRDYRINKRILKRALASSPLEVD